MSSSPEELVIVQSGASVFSSSSSSVEGMSIIGIGVGLL